MIIIERVKEIFDQLQATNSKLEKQRIIRENKDNMQFTDTLVFLLSPYILTGISTKKIDKKVKPWIYTNDYSWSSVKSYLLSHNTGTDDDIAYIQDFIANQSEDMQDFYKGLITKSIKLGCDAKIVNDVIPNLIPTWEIQQAYPLEKYKLKPNEWIALSQKLNGVHGTAMGGQMISRQGLEMNGFSHILDEIEKLGLTDYFIDGELIRNNIDGIDDEENFRRTTSIVNSDSEDKTEIDFIIYEIMPRTEFENGCTDTYKQRLEKLNEFEKLFKEKNCKYLKVVDRYYQGTDHTQIQKWLDYTESKRLEGCMLNRDTLYKKTRNNGILKVKAWKHCDLRVIGMEEGKGKYAGTLGKLVVDYKGNELRLSGMTDEERNRFWNNPSEIIGKIVLVKYKVESKDKTGKFSLNFANYISVRNDKDEPSYNYK